MKRRAVVDHAWWFSQRTPQTMLSVYSLCELGWSMWMLTSWYGDFLCFYLTLPVCSSSSETPLTVELLSVIHHNWYFLICVLPATCSFSFPSGETFLFSSILLSFCLTIIQARTVTDYHPFWFLDKNAITIWPSQLYRYLIRLYWCRGSQHLAHRLHIWRYGLGFHLVFRNFDQ